MAAAEAARRARAAASCWCRGCSHAVARSSSRRAAALAAAAACCTVDQRRRWHKDESRTARRLGAGVGAARPLSGPPAAAPHHHPCWQGLLPAGGKWLLAQEAGRPGLPLNAPQDTAMLAPFCAFCQLLKHASLAPAMLDASNPLFNASRGFPPSLPPRPRPPVRDWPAAPGARRPTRLRSSQTSGARSVRSKRAPRCAEVRRERVRVYRVTRLGRPVILLG
jgi:hypothetical protein